jgi:RNA ligase (TIGR02306 family)
MNALEEMAKEIDDEVKKEMVEELKTKSTSQCEVVNIGKITKHPNADSLGLVKIWDYEVVVRLSDWQDDALAIYIPPDNIVPDLPEFAFLDNRRIKAKKLRNIWSQGLLIPNRQFFDNNGNVIETPIGTNVADLLGIVHYEPKMIGGEGSQQYYLGGFCGKAPTDVNAPVYDIDSGFKYGKEFVEGEEVIATEKIHGANFRIVFSSFDNTLYVGSHRTWKKEGDGCKYWNAVNQNPWLRQWCEEHPNIVVYAEMYGTVQKGFPYGAKEGELFIAVFDLRKDARFIANDEARVLGSELRWVPVVYRGPWVSVDHMKEISMGKSLIPGANHIREGVVVKPIVERFSQRMQDRLQVKFVSPDYLSKEK